MLGIYIYNKGVKWLKKLIISSRVPIRVETAGAWKIVEVGQPADGKLCQIRSKEYVFESEQDKTAKGEGIAPLLVCYAEDTVGL